MAVRETLQPLLEQPETVRTLHDRTAEALKKSHESLRQLGQRQLVDAISGLLDVDLGELVYEAFDGWRELREEAERTRNPRGECDVALHHEEFEAARGAVLDLLVNGKAVDKIRVQLLIHLDLRALEAHLSDGCLTRLTSGHCAITATLVLDDVPMPPYEKEITLTVCLSVDPPRSLCRPLPPPPPEPPPPPPRAARPADG